MKDVTEKIIQALEAESFPTHENHSAVWLDTAIAAVEEVIKSYKEENKKIHNRAVREHQAKYEAIKRAETICEWTYQDKFYLHKTSCGKEDTYDTSYKFCPYCGRKVEIINPDVTREEVINMKKVVFVSIDEPSRWSQWHSGRTETIYYSDFLDTEDDVNAFVKQIRKDYPDNNLDDGSSGHSYFIRYVVLNLDENDESTFKNLKRMMEAYNKYGN